MRLKYYSGEQVLEILETVEDPSDYLNLLQKFASATTADVRENVHAHWEEADKYGNRRCSNCKSVEHVPTLMGKPIVWDFCPNCGSVMDERREDEESTKRID